MHKKHVGFFKSQKCFLLFGLTAPLMGQTPRRLTATLGEGEKKQSPGLSAVTRTEGLLFKPGKCKIQNVKTPAEVVGDWNLGKDKSAGIKSVKLKIHACRQTAGETRRLKRWPVQTKECAIAEREGGLKVATSAPLLALSWLVVIEGNQIQKRGGSWAALTAARLHALPQICTFLRVTHQIKWA